MNEQQQTAAQAESSTKAVATILCVDDESNILSSLRRLFRSEGYKILIAESGAAGLEILEQEPVDIVISDMRMPEMDGAEFLEQVAKRWPETVRLLLTGYADMQSTIDAINKGNIYKYINKPWEDTELKLTVHHAIEQKMLKEERDRLLVITEKQNAELKDLNANLEDKVQQRTAELKQTMGMLEKAHESLKKNYIASVKVFSGIIEMREGNAPGHSRRVAAHAHKLAGLMGLTGDKAQDVLFAALLHDIGKISLPDEVLSKPFSALSEAEKQKVYQHPILGEGILMAVEPLHNAARIISAHHECYDGRGYPARLKGDKIPKGAAILSVVNDYDGLQSGAIFPRQYSETEARKYIKEHRGLRYDPVVVDAFLKMLGEEPPQVAKQRPVSIKSEDLKAGMVLAKSIITKDGVLLLSDGHIIDEHIIEKIIRFERSIGKRFELYIEQRRH